MAVTLNWPATLPAPSSDDYSVTETPRIKLAKFDDGYELRDQDGINPLERDFRMSWHSLTTDQKNTMIDFLRSTRGTASFNWTPKNESSITVRAVRWSISRRSGPLWVVHLELRETFDV